MKLILPRTLIPTRDINSPLFFLMGPIRGGGDWQKDACELLHQNVPDCWVANPCRYEANHPLNKFKVEGQNGFMRQLPWERHYLGLASKLGCIIAWLPCESKTDPRKDGGPYARDTLGELGEWRGRMMHGETHQFVLGAEPDFPGLDVIIRNFEFALHGNFEVSDTLEKTVLRASLIAEARR